MATFTSDQAASGHPIYSGICPPNVLQWVYGTINIGTNPADGDIYELVKVPACTVITGFLQAADIDTGTEVLDMDIGWAANGTESADPDGFGNLGVLTGDTSVHLPVAGIWIPFAGVLQTAPQAFTAKETTIQVEANVAANAGGTGRMSAIVGYVT